MSLSAKDKLALPTYIDSQIRSFPYGSSELLQMVDNIVIWKKTVHQASLADAPSLYNLHHPDAGLPNFIKPTYDHNKYTGSGQICFSPGKRFRNCPN